MVGHNVTGGQIRNYDKHGSFTPLFVVHLKIHYLIKNDLQVSKLTVKQTVPLH